MHIGAMGQSAGGQLASLIGTVDRSAGFDVGQYPAQTSRVQAVADEWGPVIFDAAELKILNNVRAAFESLDPAALKRYSPLTYLTKDDPPFLVVQGAEDVKVPRYQSETFAKALRKAGISEQLIMVHHAGHNLLPIAGAPPATPSVARVDAILVEFFFERLRG
jgi:acetyl esterase/lipase